MRGILFLLALLLPAAARAQSFTTPVAEQLQSTHTCAGVAISSQTPTDIIVSSAALYRFAAVQNLDASNDIYCSDSVSVSTIAANILQGMDVAKGSPGATVTWTLPPGQRWYCLTTKTTGTSTAIICRGR